MFDDPKKELEALQRQLLAAEAPVEEAETDETPEQALEDVRRMLRQEDWDDEARQPLYRRYVPEEPEEIRRPQKPAEPVRKKKTGGNGALIFALILESIALLLVIVWWILWKR